MNINFDDKEIETLIQKEVNKKIESVTRATIHEYVEHFIKWELDYTYSNGRMKGAIEREIAAQVKELMPQFDDELLNKLADRISDEIAEKLRVQILESLSYRLRPYTDDDDEDE